MAKWVRVRRGEGNQCPVCNHADWCAIAADGTVAKCMRVQSEREVKHSDGSIGWLHELHDKYEPPKWEPRKVEKKHDWTDEARQMFVHAAAKSRRERTARQLGVPEWTLEELFAGVGWDKHNGREYTSFPAYDDRGVVVGITRRYDSGQKKSLAGTSNSGIFMKRYWWKTDGPIYIVEGSSDVAACLARGLCALGRPSNVGGAPVVLRLLRRRAPEREVIVIGEEDRKWREECDLCEGCSLCFPGLYGARAVKESLSPHRGPVDVAMLSKAKDMRDFLCSGKHLHDLRRDSECPL